MAVRTDFVAGEVLAAQDLDDTFASKTPFTYGTATPSTTVKGFIWYDEKDTPPAPKFWDGAAFQSIGGGKILQVVRATDTTSRTTTSTSFVDVTGMSVTITPKKSTSAIIVIVTGFFETNSTVDTDNRGSVQITDASNNALSGAQGSVFGVLNLNGSNTRATYTNVNLLGYATPGTTSAITYKTRFASQTNSVTSKFNNNSVTGQMFAIEVSA